MKGTMLFWNPLTFIIRIKTVEEFFEITFVVFHRKKKKESHKGLVQRHKEQWFVGGTIPLRRLGK